MAFQFQQTSLWLVPPEAGKTLAKLIARGYDMVLDSRIECLTASTVYM